LLKRTGPIPDTVRGYDPDVFVYPTDLERAKELLTAGGFAEGDVFEYMFDSNDERDTTVAQLFQANLQQIGFDLDLLAVDIATLENTIFGDAEAEDRPHMMSWGWWPDYNDPWNQLAPNFNEDAIGDGGGNGGFWVNARYKEIMAEAETFSDPARLDELMLEAQNIVTEQDPPAIYFGQVIRYTVLGSDIVGFVPNPVYLDGFNFYSMSRASE
jgi:peptide/nickel transport system substrate-binding protein